MLAKVIMRPISCTVVGIDAHVGVFLGDDIDNTGYGIAAIERTLGTLHYLNLLDVLRVDKSKVVLTAHVAVDALAVDEYQDIVVAQSVQLHLTAHVALAESEARGQSRQDVLKALAAVLA